MLVEGEQDLDLVQLVLLLQQEQEALAVAVLAVLKYPELLLQEQILLEQLELII
tara:strand:- start:194 stop:355 length:162 start_codon:yes stop_codon:yes gene_type:complete